MKAKILVVASLILGLTAPVMAAENLKDMFTQGTVKAQLRLMDYKRDTENVSTVRDTAFGGLLYYKTDSFKGISLAAAFATTNGVIDNDEYGTYYGILAADHESVTRSQEYYIQGDYFDTQIKIGAQETVTPFLSPHDVRMIPRTFRGISAVNTSVKNLKLSGYYLTDAMTWTDKKFIDIGVDDVYIAGASYQVPLEAVKTNVQAWYFTMPDAYDQMYFTASFSKKVNDMILHASPTFFTQKSQGDELDGPLDTYQYGFNAGVSAFGFDLTGFYAKTGDDNIIDPWGYRKIVIQQVKNAARADEDTFAARLAYDFSTVGVKGLSAYVFYADYDTPESGANASDDQTETDLNIQYAFSGALDGFTARVRHAMVDVESGNDITDTRFILTYKFSFSGK